MYKHIHEDHSINNGSFLVLQKLKFFSINVNSALFWIVFIAKIILISKKICFEAIQNGRKSNSAPDFRRGLSSNVWWLGSAIHMKL